MKLESKSSLKLKKNLYKISLLSFVVVVIWIGFEIYFSYTKPKSPETASINLEPITPNLYLDLAQTLNQRLSIPPADLEAFKATLPQDFTQVPTPSEAPTTPSRHLSPAPESSPSAGFGSSTNPTNF